MDLETTIFTRVSPLQSFMTHRNRDLSPVRLLGVVSGFLASSVIAWSMPEMTGSVARNQWVEEVWARQRNTSEARALVGQG